MRKVRRFNCVHILESIGNIYSAVEESRNHEATEADDEILNEVHRQTKEAAERYRVVFRSESTAINHLMQIWGI